MGETDHDEPVVPILTQKEARLSLVIRSFWIILHVSTCLVVIANTIHKWESNEKIKLIHLKMCGMGSYSCLICSYN